MKDPWDVAAFIIVTSLVLLGSVLSSFEGIQVDFTKKGKNFRGGAHQRRVFYFAVLIATLYKFICMVIEATLFSNSSCAESHLCSYVRFSPDVAFITAYSVMITFWIQLGCDISGIPSSALKYAVCVGMSVLMLLFVMLMLLHPKNEPNMTLFIYLGVVHILFFVVVIISGLWTSRHITSTATIGQRVLNRMVALCVTCCYSSLIGAALYLFVMQTLWTVGYPHQRLFLFDGIVVFLKDVIPMYSILHFTSKRGPSQSQLPRFLSLHSSGNNPYVRINEI